MIVELNGTSLKEARGYANRFLERTAPVKSMDGPAPRTYTVSKAAARIERERMRAKVSGTKRLRDGLLSVLEDWRSDVVSAVRKSKVKEANVADIDAELAAAVAAGVLTDEQRQGIVAAVNAALASMDPKKLIDVINEVQKEIFEAGLASASGEIGLTWDSQPTVALDELSNTVIPFSQAIVQREQAAILQALYDGIAAGDGVPQLADRIQNSFDDGMHVLDADGNVTRVIPSDSWAEMVARTETSRAMNAAVMHAYHAAGVAQVMWIAAEDELTCAQCQDLDGDVVPLGANFDGDVSAPPAHPSCRCTVVSAKVAQAAEDEQDVAA